MLELFATQEREGWDCLGHKISGLDIREELIKLTIDIPGELFVVKPSLDDVPGQMFIDGVRLSR